ncbi:MAG: Ig-like domain-containing protein [Gammaproteobacteria bacterium]|nr:Ig-like domain-containing protein [Gammaproteobacteria bacterium]
MITGLLKQFLKKTAVMAVCTSFLLVMTIGSVYAGKPPPQPLSCDISPDPGTTDEGVAITFTGSANGGAKGSKTYVWNFSDGPGDPVASSSNPVDVTYGTAGTYNVLLEATDKDGATANCSTTVTVNTVGANRAPVAQNDEYNTQQDALLSVLAPGVLVNDNDPDGDPMTAVLDVDVSAGTLNLSANGSFTFDPPAGASGSYSFTYHAFDGDLSSNTAVVTIGVTANNAVSINSTSVNGTSVPAGPVAEQPIVPNTDFAIVAINDLGMHCGDLDTRISSILPPFNVLHSQVIQRGNGSLPRILGEGEVDIVYSAASNPDDPAPAKVASGQALSSVANNGTVYKTNFWDISADAYDAFYPSGILALFSSHEDVGLPMPDVERFYLEDGYLSASQQNMAGIADPYLANDPQAFHEHIGTLPFFINFPFGYTADVNLFEAAGVPIAAFDDFGQENPYPLVRVQADVNSSTVASVDIVMPISGEAECQSCHSDDVGTGVAIENLNNTASAMDDPLYNNTVPFEVSVEWASDINLLRLHDQKHNTNLEQGYDANGKSNSPVVCQKCHYTPALDLAQLGPLGPENDTSLTLNGGTLPIASLANGRDQVKHKSMSNVMHSHHSSTGLFPDMPPAIDAQGNRRDPVLTQTILEDTCYKCHPGKRTQCMRGAMANGGLVCQDCHGQMAQVGNDFTHNVSLATPGAFDLGPDFYTNANTPRVPWANEPGCGSCHTGYATDNLAGSSGVLVSPTDTLGNSDGIRLLAAYRSGDSKATPIVPTNKAFAENVVTADDMPGDPGAIGNPKLYRVSTGHGGLFCESCHGSTHAEWPTANPNANDNIPASQLQGHSGYIAECTVCHEPNDESLPLGNNGPHGMHAVVDLDPVGPAKADDRWNFQHRNYRSQGPGCDACHGADLKGTVLSRTADDRTVWCKDTRGSLPGCAAGQQTAVIPKGTPVGCGMCHRQKR